jgi:copper transport protein
MLAAPVAQARAHATLLSSTPAQGARIPAGRVTMRFVFSEPVVASLSHVVLTGTDGSSRRIHPLADPHDVHALTAIEFLGEAAYSAEWHIVSADGHPVSGAVGFVTGDAEMQSMIAHGGGHSENSIGGIPGTVPAMLRGAGLAALLPLAGLLAFGRRGLGPRRQRTAMWLSVAASVLMIAHLIAWLLHVSERGTLDSGAVVATLARAPGVNEAVRLALVLLASWALVLARRNAVALVFAMSAVIAGGAIGHPMAVHPLIAAPLKSLHLAGVALWMGGVVWLATAPAASSFAADAARVSRIALICIVAVGLTGAAQGLLFIPSLPALGSAYGIAFMAKVAGLVALGFFGFHHRRLIAAGAARVAFPFRGELAVMTLVVLIGGLLAYIPIPHAP